jgi:plastocyanin
MRFPRAMPLLITLAAFSLAACGSDDSSSDTATTTTNEGAVGAPSGGQSGNAPAPSGEAVRSAKVEIADFQYAPGALTIQSGGKVTWLNQDSTEHTATLDDGSFSTGDLAEGKLKSESFKTPGTYAYHCEIHPEMKGTVEVIEPS